MQMSVTTVAKGARFQRQCKSDEKQARYSASSEHQSSEQCVIGNSMICTFTPSFWLATSRPWFVVLLEQEREREAGAVLVAAAASIAGRAGAAACCHKGSFTLVLLHLFTVTVTAPPLRASHIQDVTRNSLSVYLHHHDHLVLHRRSH